VRGGGGDPGRDEDALFVSFSSYGLKVVDPSNQDATTTVSLSAIFYGALWQLKFLSIIVPSILPTTGGTWPAANYCTSNPRVNHFHYTVNIDLVININGEGCW
jgi:hypothetical protein